MKKFTILIVIICCIVSSNAQNSPFKMSSEELRIKQMPSKTDKQQQRKQVFPLPEIPTPEGNVNIVDIIDIGTAPNAGRYIPNLSYVWVDPVLNTVSNIHHNSWNIVYDVSTDGGMTWNNNIVIYEPEGTDLVRNFNHGIFNPDNNTDPDDAFIAFCAFSGSVDPVQNGFLNGVGNIGDTLNRTASLLPDDPRYHHNIPKGYDLTSEGKTFLIDANIDWVDSEMVYLDSLIIVKGNWDDNQEIFNYERENLEALVDDELGAPVDYKVAFGPDGQTGYIVMLADNGEAEQVEGFKNLYPIYWKTTDAGETWEGPEVVQLDGPNGVEGIVNHHLTDQQIEELFGNNPPPREEISYTTAYDCEITVDRDNRLHIAVVIGPTGSDPHGIVTADYFIAAYDIFQYDESQPFCGVSMGDIRTFRGTFGDMSTVDNRIQITTTPEHDMIFVSWLDTDLEEEEDNNRPNIWCRGFDPYRIGEPLTSNRSGEYAPFNVTSFSAGMWEAYLASAPKYTFAETDNGWVIPYVFIDFDPNDPSSVAQFKYVQNFDIGYTDWNYEVNHYLECGWVGLVENTSLNIPVVVSGNFPNPFKNETTIQIELYKADEVDVIVTSITGQQLLEKNFGKLNQGQHDLKLELNNLSSGIYFYTVTAGTERVTRKMVLE